jgi:hypothetical protein
VAAVPGGTAPTGLATAPFVPPPHFEAKIASIQGHRERLRLAYLVPAGDRVSLIERGKRIVGSIATAVHGHSCGARLRQLSGGETLRCATITFTPTAGPGGLRQVIADVTGQNGMPVGDTTIAHFIASAQALPSRPGQLRIVRVHNRVIVSWRASTPAKLQTIAVRLGSGAGFGLTTPRCSVIELTGVRRDESVAISVAGARAADLQTGPFARELLARRKTHAGAAGHATRKPCLVHRIDHLI